MRFKADLSKEKSTTVVSESEPAVKVEEKVVSPELTQLALGVWHNVVTNTFHLVKMKYDPITKTSGEVEVGEGVSRVEADYYFKVAAGNNFL